MSWDAGNNIGWRHNWKKYEEKSHYKSSDRSNGHKRQAKDILDTFIWVIGEKHKQWQKTQAFKDTIQGNFLIRKCVYKNWKNSVYQEILTQTIITRNILVRLNSKNEGRIFCTVEVWSNLEREKYQADFMFIFTATFHIRSWRNSAAQILRERKREPRMFYSLQLHVENLRDEHCHEPLVSKLLMGQILPIKRRLTCQGQKN